MVEAKLENDNWKKLLEEEKTTNKKLLDARSKEIKSFKNKNKELEEEVNKLKETNGLLKATLGHF